MKSRLSAFVSLLVLLVFPIVATSQTQTVRISELKGNVTVRRDDRSIPYINADNDGDLDYRHRRRLLPARVAGGAIEQSTALAQSAGLPRSVVEQPLDIHVDQHPDPRRVLDRYASPLGTPRRWAAAQSAQQRDA